MSDSSLWRLSPELRNRIYEYTFAGSIVYLDNFNQHTTALLRVCSVIRRESRLLLLAQVHLQLSAHSPYASERQIPSNNIARQLRRAFGRDGFQILEKREIMLRDDGLRCIRLSCRKCAFFEGLKCSEMEQPFTIIYELIGQLHTEKYLFSGRADPGSEIWDHAGWSCWKRKRPA